MKFKSIRELQSCKGLVYGGDLAHKAIRLQKRDWEALKAYAKANGTSAGEIVRALISEFLVCVEMTSPRDRMRKRAENDGKTVNRDCAL